MPLKSSVQKGFAPILIIIAVAVVGAIGGYLLLGKSGKAPSIPGVPSGVTLNPNCKYNDPDLCKFVNNFKEIKNFGSKSTSTEKSGGKFEATFETSGQDKTRMVYTQDGKENYNIITIADTTYTKDYSDNKWWKQKQPKETPKPNEKTTNIQDEIAKTEQPEDKTTYKKVGMEACDSRQCFKYQIIDPANTDSTEYIWFDNKEYLMRKTRSEGKDGSVTETTVYYDNINITAPSPTKDAAPNQIITPAGGIPGMSQQDLKDLQDSTKQMQQQMPNQPDLSQPDSSSDGN